MKAMHIFVAAALAFTSAAGAQQPQGAGDHASHHPAAATVANALSEGEVRKVDVAQGKVTLRHGPLANLDMPPMTMVFSASDPKMLEGLKQGDPVRFRAEKRDGGYVVTAIDRAR